MTEHNKPDHAAAKVFCEQHAWSYVHDPNSIPKDYRECMVCKVIDCSDAISTYVDERTIAERSWLVANLKRRNREELLMLAEARLKNAERKRKQELL